MPHIEHAVIRAVWRLFYCLECCLTSEMSGLTMGPNECRTLNCPYVGAVWIARFLLCEIGSQLWDQIPNQSGSNKCTVMPCLLHSPLVRGHNMSFLRLRTVMTNCLRFFFKYQECWWWFSMVGNLREVFLRQYICSVLQGDFWYFRVVMWH